jgi:acyl-homoserine lactone acylase PvdQ
MFVLAAFVSVSMAAVLFLLRFLIALFPSAKPASGRVERISAVRASGRTRLRTSVPGFTLIHSNSSRKVVYAPGFPVCAGVPQEEFSDKGV